MDRARQFPILLDVEYRGLSDRGRMMTASVSVLQRPLSITKHRNTERFAKSVYSIL